MTIIVLTATLWTTLTALSQSEPQTVLFVCEHGAAKSVVAAAHFNQLAAERGLPLRAISRGTVPNLSVPARVVEGLGSEGLTLPPGFTPSAVTDADLKGAVRVVTFDVSLPSDAGASPVNRWDNLPAFSADYGKASEAIRRKVQSFLDELTVPIVQETPAEYAAFLKTIEKTGDYKDGVLKANIPRNDLRVTISGRPVPTPLGFGGWLALTPGSGGSHVMMGDLVLTEAEVNPVMSALLDNGLEVTALHNHFFYEEPRIFYMHVHGMGTPADLARRVRPAVALIGKPAEAGSQPAPQPAPPAIDGTALATIIGHSGEFAGSVYKITIGRPDIDLRAHGARINARMGLNTWAAFAGTDKDAVVAGDVAMLESELTPVLKALRASGLDVVAIHHHMTGVQPMVVFLHYYGKGEAAALARGVRAAVDLTGKRR